MAIMEGDVSPHVEGDKCDITLSQGCRKRQPWHGSLKGQCIWPGTPLCVEGARRLAKHFVEHYNNVRLHSSIGYVAPKDKLQGREEAIFAERGRKLEGARERRKVNRQRARSQHRGKCQVAERAVGATQMSRY